MEILVKALAAEISESAVKHALSALAENGLATHSFGQ
jgi:hypothetical protein